jgi:uncharacterized spore protein YtfJ
VNVDEMLARIRKSVEAKMVYAEPVERDGVTVIPAAKVFAGGGGGSGKDQHGGQGDGGGLGFTARPVGVFIIKNGEVRWEPAVDVNRNIAIAGAVVIAALSAAARVLRSR